VYTHVPSDSAQENATYVAELNIPNAKPRAPGRKLLIIILEANGVTIDWAAPIVTRITQTCQNEFEIAVVVKAMEKTAEAPASIVSRDAGMLQKHTSPLIFKDMANPNIAYAMLNAGPARIEYSTEP
jgi:hypothetical protein